MKETVLTNALQFVMDKSTFTLWREEKYKLRIRLQEEISEFLTDERVKSTIIKHFRKNN